MNESEIADALQRIMAPTLPPPNWQQSILSRVRVRRRRRFIGALVAGCAIGAISIAFASSVWQSQRFGPAGTSHEAPIDARGGSFGFHMEMTMSFPISGDIVGGHFDVAGQQFKANFYDNDAGYDSEGMLPIPVQSGDHVLGGTGFFEPQCGQANALPTLIVETQVDGGAITRDTFTVSNPAAYDSAVATWCSMPVQAGLVSEDVSPDGDATYRLSVINPSTRAVSVVCGALHYGNTDWEQSSATVPANGNVILTVRASGYHGGPTPWSVGLLTANDAVVEVGE